MLEKDVALEGVKAGAPVRAVRADARLLSGVGEVVPRQVALPVKCTAADVASKGKRFSATTRR